MKNISYVYVRQRRYLCYESMAIVGNDSRRRAVRLLSDDDNTSSLNA